MKESFQKARDIFAAKSGILRTSQANKLGIASVTLSEMVQAGLLIKEGRGLYRLAELPPLSNPDLVQVALRVPQGVICLISALAFHNLTTQIPYRVYLALPQAVKKPRIDYPPIDVVWLSQRAYHAGIEKHIIDDVNIQIYNREKTVADCFKFRNKIGQDVALEALKEYLGKQRPNFDELLHYARIDRVEKMIRPYLEVLL
jgi:predicted transcriptional regulator of viral defense system